MTALEVIDLEQGRMTPTPQALRHDLLRAHTLDSAQQPDEAIMSAYSRKKLSLPLRSLVLPLGLNASQRRRMYLDWLGRGVQEAWKVRLAETLLSSVSYINVLQNGVFYVEYYGV